MIKARKPKEAGKALMRRFTALIMGAWLITMWLLTYATAKDFLFQMYFESKSFARTGFANRVDENEAACPGIAEYGMVTDSGAHYLLLEPTELFPFQMDPRPTSINSDDWFFGKWDMIYGYEAAVLYYDREEDFYLSSGNYLAFSYSLKENVTPENPDGVGYGYIDLDAWDGCMEMMSPYIVGWHTGDWHVGFFLDTVILTGYFDGAELIPTSIYLGSYHDYETDSEVRREWINTLSDEQIPANSKSVTFNARDVFGFEMDYEPVTVNGISYDSLSDMLESQMREGDFCERLNLWDAVFIHDGRNNFYVNDEVVRSYSYAVAVRCWPMEYAALRLLPTYAVTLVAAFILIRLLRRRITRSLVTPLERAITGIDQCLPMEPWQEAQTLMDRMRESKEALHDANTENQQLRTALDYARDAEEKRRRLVSDLTHELKTPLAIIHGYAEGLKSGIAQEKKERYLDVILEESERMDAMVLQMLDLSRLEAGKVKLSADRFSLLELAKKTVEKFSLAIEEKGLQVYFLRADEFDITADESRMTQVVTNLVSNAVKYADPGGNIRIWVYKYREGVRFEIENTAPLLTDEALEKVFDSFYRTDPSRTEPGTGLGLAIVKGIVQLHGGKCIARNKKYTNETCVEFSVALPVD